MTFGITTKILKNTVASLRMLVGFEGTKNIKQQKLEI